ncbi:hypothetical protein [Burkholderia sp. FL-7-2-10-S1-D7]|uniref:hypothetical protein n=1 Tax=Burkholderia sp. FL-7-2-10-S1-D7 TaxID=1637866 RepID=UPI000AEE2B64|nr:hypothetical protein [Burkholderia sp. FL-7-2-10-S1-D7]
MTKETLKLIRILVPGIVILLILYPIFFGFSVETLLHVDSKAVVYIFAAVTIGAIYRTVGFRNLALSGTWDKINSGIVNSLADAIKDEVGQDSDWKLRRSKILLDVFYRIIDNDKSLSERAKDVYENGAFISSYCDIAAICFGGSLCYWAYHFTAGAAAALALEFSGFLLAISVIFYFCLCVAVREHIRLGQRQTQYIARFKRNDLLEDVKSCLISQ